MTAVVPIRSIKKTFPEAGRIRLGVKAKTAQGKEYPKSIDTFRLTSQYRAPLDQAAEAWGGEVRPWNDQFEVITQTNSLDIVLPMGEGFDPLGGTPVYELWSAGGCTRRCDGETMIAPTSTGPDTVEMTESPCVCAAKGILECSPKLRLTVGLPDLDFYGFWRLETGSMYAIQENQGMLELVATLQAHGIQRGVLTLERREIKKPGAKTKKFVVPIIRLAGSMNELQSGASRMASLGPAAEQRPELPSPTPSGGDGESVVSQAQDVSIGTVEATMPPRTDSPSQSDVNGSNSLGGSEPEPSESPDAGGREGGPSRAAQPSLGGEDIIDAELVEDEPPAFVLAAADRSRYRSAFMARTKGLGLDYDSQTKPWLQQRYKLPEGEGWSALSDEQAQNLYDALIVPDGSRAEKEAAGEKFKSAVLDTVEAKA